MSAIPLTRFLQKSADSEQALAVLSVNGGRRLNDQLIDSVSRQSELIILDHALQSFTSKPRFDLLFYSLPSNEYNRALFHEDLCYCRMLLKPGGKLCFVTPPHRTKTLTGCLSWKKSEEVASLARAGFSKISKKRIGYDLRLLCGQRPKKNF